MVALIQHSMKPSKLSKISIPILKVYISLIFGKDVSSLNEIRAVLSEENIKPWKLIEAKIMDLRPKYMKDKLFLYNFLYPILEFADSQDLKSNSYLQDYIRWLLDESDKLILCRLYDHIMVPDMQKEFRVLNLLNINDKPSSQNITNLLKVSGNPEHQLMDRFLWPTHRLEDLACMNRFWFSSSNHSKFSALRTNMYPLEKS